MTPHDHMQQRPGARFVIDTLAADPEQLVLRHSSADPCGPVARAVAAAAREVDSLHQTLLGRAAEAIRALGPVARGEDPDLPMASGVLGATAHDIDLLAARRGAAHQHLVRLVTVYQQLSPDSTAAVMSARLDRGQGGYREAADVDADPRATAAVTRSPSTTRPAPPPEADTPSASASAAPSGKPPRTR